MTNIVAIADVHIRVDDLPIESSWNYQRLMLLADEINKLDYIDAVWIIGDLFDRSLPTVGDIAAATAFLNRLYTRTYYLEGNHERINKDVYTLGVLQKTLGIRKLREVVEINGVSVTCIGHDNIHKIKDLPPSDLLLSHFRWSHDIFGKGELSNSVEEEISKKFTNTILGDIHYTYTPKPNVTYISSPYSINFGTPKEYGMVMLKFNKGKFTFDRIHLDLPSKISTKLPIHLVNGFIDGIETKHLYRVVVSLRHNQLEEFRKLKVPDNVELLPKFLESGKEDSEVSKIEVGSNIKDVLIKSLKLPESSDVEYIKSILKEK